MNDSTGKPSSCLAITEKKALKPGGCVGIFFQLFDWNKRLAKKKLFSKKFLLPARTKQAVKKLKGDEIMPTSKDKLIANENSGGFPSSKRNASIDSGEKHEMRAPGLIARLMGLEAIPEVNKDKSKKTSFAESCGVGVENFVGKHSKSHRKDVHMEVVVAKQESRPLKLQKTEVSERRAVSRFHTEALQIKSALSQARKHHHHHPKLVSPLKSPKISSTRSSNRSSRLIGAATKMLEPGLQATRRAKSTLTYSRSMLSPKDRVGATGTEAPSPGLADRCSYTSSATKPLIRQASCKTCGNRVDIMDSMSNFDVQQGLHAPAAPTVANTSSLVSDLKKDKACILSCEKGRGGFQRNLYQVISPSAQEIRRESRDNIQPHIESISREFPLRHEVFTQWNISSQINSPQKEESSIDIKRKTIPQDRMSFGGDGITHKSRLSSEPCKRAAPASNATARKTKEFVAQNRSLSQSRGRILSTNVDYLKLEPERKPSKKYDDSLPDLRPSVRKRRTENAYLEDERTATFSGQIRCNALGGSRRLLSSPYSKHVDVRSKPDSHKGIDSARKANDVISFSLDSPIKEKTRSLTRNEERSRYREVNAYIQNTLPLKGDDLSSFLEQPFKELNTREDEESAGALHKKSKATILQDLISAIMDGRPVLRNGRMVNEEIGFYNEQKDANRERSLGVSPGGSHLSPGSVLEASFSSSSLDESTGKIPKKAMKHLDLGNNWTCQIGNLGNIVHPDSMEYSNDQFQFWGTDDGILESVNSFNKGRMTCLEALTSFANNLPKMLDCINISGSRMTRSRLAHVKNVIINTELLFRNATVDGARNLFVTHLLIDELQNIASFICKYFNGCWDGDEEGSKLRGFLFDSLIEYLDSNYCQYPNCGFKTWTKQILGMKAEMLLAEVELEISKWASLTGMITDELIEWDMSHSLGKWTRFEAVAFEIGAAMGHDIIQILIEEIVADIAEYV